MKNKYFKIFATYSDYILTILFWIYFIFFSFTYKKLSNTYIYILFLLLGIYLGYNYARWALKYLRRENENMENS